MRILLVSTYELGHQPLGLASPAAVLRRAGHAVHCLDLAIESPESAAFNEAELIGISVPMHTAARLGIALAEKVRRINPDAHICFYGLYASLLHDSLTAGGIADSVVGGEYEPGLRRLAGALAAGSACPQPPTGVGAAPAFEREALPMPDRSGLPPLCDYARLDLGAEQRLVGYVEASRGCAHCCRHCPITPVYEGRLRLARSQTVLADVDQLVQMGARHITFGDPDFFNAVPLSLGIVEEMHRLYPDLTFDATIKVEHLLEHAQALPRLRESGGLFLTSAFESCDDETLRLLDKGHTRADMERALDLVHDVGLAIRPTWLPFMPWTDVRGFVEILEFIETRGLVANVQPVQVALRLLLPPGSPLVEALREQGRLGPYDAAGLTYTWTNPDPRVATLQREVTGIVEAAARRDERDNVAVFAEVKRAAMQALTGLDAPVGVAPQPAGVVPGLTEAWFC